MNIKRIKIDWVQLLLHAVFIILVLLCVYPILLMIGISFSSEIDIVKHGYSLVPRNITTYAYEFMAKTGDMFVRAYGVTIFVTLIGAVGSTMLTALYAYPLSRKEFGLNKFFTMFVFFTMLLSGGLVPWYFVCVRLLHINDTIWAMIAPYLMNGFFVIIMRTFYRTTIPDEIIEAARIDGSGEFSTFVKIVLPLTKPALATIALFATLQYWNDYFLPLMLVNDSELFNLQFLMYKILMTLETIQSTPAGQVANVYQKLPSESARMAMAVVTIGPIVIAYPFFQRYFVKGLTVGAVKG